jgi:hypothetical protein
MVDFPHTTPAAAATLHPCSKLLHGSIHSLTPSLGHINGVQPSVATGADESNTAAICCSDFIDRITQFRVAALALTVDLFMD